MLEGVIDQLDKLKYAAQGIDDQINNQQKLIKKL
jgi:hypothetical protein